MNSNQRVFIIVGAVFAAVGFGMLGGSLWSGLRQQRVIKTWRQVEAVVVRSRVSTSSTYDRNQGGDLTLYTPAIEFRYDLEGRSFVTPAHGQVSTSNYASAKREADTYAPGSVHPILVNPSEPADIRFDAGYTWSFFFMPLLLGAMGLIFGIVGGSLLLAARGAVTIRCPSCGTVVEKGQKFCSNCAAPVQHASDSSRTPSNR